MPPEVPGARPNTVASHVSYLVQPESHFITGETLLNVLGNIVAETSLTGQIMSVDGGLNYD